MIAFLWMSLSRRLFIFYNFLRDKLIYYVFDCIYILTVEVVLVLQEEIKPVSTSGITNLLSLQNLIVTQMLQH